VLEFLLPSWIELFSMRGENTIGLLISEMSLSLFAVVSMFVVLDSSASFSMSSVCVDNRLRRAFKINLCCLLSFSFAVDSLVLLLVLTSLSLTGSDEKSLNCSIMMFAILCYYTSDSWLTWLSILSLRPILPILSSKPPDKFDLSCILSFLEVVKFLLANCDLLFMMLS